MDNQGQNGHFQGTNNGPLSPVGTVADSYSQMSLSGIRNDDVLGMQQLQNESLGIGNRSVQSVGPQSLPGDGNILAQAVDELDELDEGHHRSVILLQQHNLQQCLSYQPTEEPQIMITNQPSPNDFKFR